MIQVTYHGNRPGLFSVNKNETAVNIRSNRAVGRVLMFISIIDKPCLMSNSLGLASCKCVENNFDLKPLLATLTTFGICKKIWCENVVRRCE